MNIMLSYIHKEKNMFEHLLNCHGEWTIFLGLLPSWALVPYWFKIGVYGTQNEEAV
tara:strand:+ start:683 stop:850 length:168 start_codon:yes stop_codon:yes gene_type:complete